MVAGADLRRYGLSSGVFARICIYGPATCRASACAFTITEALSAWEAFVMPLVRRDLPHRVAAWPFDQPTVNRCGVDAPRLNHVLTPRARSPLGRGGPSGHVVLRFRCGMGAV